jgi:tetratricopeptide (TPR) repeat protein
MRMTDEDITTGLRQRKRDELIVIAKRLKVKNYSRVNKEQLVTLLLEALKKSTPKQVRKVLSVSRWDRFYYHLFGWSSVTGCLIGVIALPLAVAGIILALRSSTPNSNKKNDEAVVSHFNRNDNTENTSEVLSPSPTPNPSPSTTPIASPSRVQEPPNKEAVKQAPLYLSRARALYSQAKYKEALDFCNRALGLEPKNKEALKLRSDIERTIAILKNN